MGLFNGKIGSRLQITLFFYFIEISNPSAYFDPPRLFDLMIQYLPPPQTHTHTHTHTHTPSGHPREHNFKYSFKDPIWTFRYEI